MQIEILDENEINVVTNDGWNELPYEEKDPLFGNSPAYSITETDKTNWNNKSEFSGDYSDLTNKPSIPSKTSDLTNDSNYARVFYVSTEENNYTYGQISGLINNNYEICLKVDGYNTSSVGEPIANLVRCNQTSMCFSFISAVYSETYTYKFANNRWERETFDLATDDVYDEIPYKTSQLTNDSGFLTQHQDISGKQDTLVSGTNIKTVNNESILGSGNITIQGGGTSNYNDLSNKPSINNITLSGNKSLSDLGIQPTSNKVTSITSSSTNTQYPSAKAVYDLFTSITDGDEVSY